MTRAGSKILRTALAALVLAPLGLAQEDDRPALGVARVSLTNGDVTIRRGDSGDWIQAPVNTPLVEGDTIATGRASRAEVQLDYSNLLRLNESSEVKVTNLGKRQFRVQVARGIVTYSELRGGEADVDVETPLVAVRPGKKGRYRVEVSDQDHVRVIVRKGQAEVASSQGVETLKQGQMMVVRRGDDGPEFLVEKATPKDHWDEFNERRDKHLQKSDSYTRLSRSIYGAEDLDDNGRWRYVSGYGNTWFPSVGYGWAPYRHGRWSWIDYYGWTWTSYEPWGWAPYHYGRWFHYSNFGWGWYPGPHYGHHYWRPALVTFFGFGHYGGGYRFNFGFGVGFGRRHHYGYSHFGWIPLAPGERYYPWYGHGYGGHGGRHNTVHVDNSVNIYNNYRNARHHNGVSAIRGEAFARGRVGTPRSLRPSELRQATAMRGQLPVVPSRESRGRSASPTDFRRASTSGASGRQTRFFTTNRGRATPQRASFRKQQERMAGSVRAFASTRSRNTRGGTTAAASSRGGAAGAAGLGAAGAASRARTGSGSRSPVVRTPSALSGARTTTRSTATRGRTGGRTPGGLTPESTSTDSRRATGFPRAATRPGSGSSASASPSPNPPAAGSQVGASRSGNRSTARGTTGTVSAAPGWQGFGRARTSRPRSGRGGVGATTPGTRTPAARSGGGPSATPAESGGSSTRGAFRGFPRTRSASPTRSTVPRSSSAVPSRPGSSSPASARSRARGTSNRTSSSTSAWRRFGGASRSPGRSAPASRARTGSSSSQTPVRQRGGSSSRTFELSRPSVGGAPRGSTTFGTRTRSRVNSGSRSRSSSGAGAAGRSIPSASPGRSSSRGSFAPRSRSRVAPAAPSSRGTSTSASRSRAAAGSSGSRAGGFVPRSRSRASSSARSSRSSSSPRRSRAPSTARSSPSRSRGALTGTLVEALGTHAAGGAVPGAECAFARFVLTGLHLARPCLGSPQIGGLLSRKPFDRT